LALFPFGWLAIASFGLDKAAWKLRFGLILALFLAPVFRLTCRTSYPQALFLGPNCPILGLDFAPSEIG
jgi:hypothetical protein